MTKDFEAYTARSNAVTLQLRIARMQPFVQLTSQLPHIHLVEQAFEDLFRPL